MIAAYDIYGHPPGLVSENTKFRAIHGPIIVTRVDVLTITQPVRVTKMNCAAPNELMVKESTYPGVLKHATKYPTINNPLHIKGR